MKAHRIVERLVGVSVDTWRCDYGGEEQDQNDDDPNQGGMPLGWWELVRRNPMNGTMERKHACPECVGKMGRAA